MKVLIDTSYFLPFIKIKIKNIPQNLLITLFKNYKHKYYYSDLTIFELIAKGLKLSSKDNAKITPEDIRIGIDSIQNDERLKNLSYMDCPFIIELTSTLRKIHKDTIDCLIFATAFCVCDCLITMDVSFFNQITQNSDLIEKINEINENFKFWFNDLSEGLKSISLNNK
ncbi:MAG: hypothetical protein EU547_03710 [Promethearchaeota archaeon]|nr:MAG: hypothetical protein EU547_03710 [Candidatus Lokiarchaeota archaeon]